MIACAAVVNEPTDFLKALPSVLPGLNNITLFKGKENYYDYLADLTYQKNIHTVSYLFGDNTRAAQKVGMASYIPTDLSTLGANRTAVAPNNVFVAQVTEMAENGCFQLSYCEMFEKQMLECAETIILEVNPQFRRVRGGLDIHISQVSALYLSPKAPFILPRDDGSSEIDRKIGNYIADLIPDAATIQLGIGRLPDAVAVRLAEKNDLGLHTEMFTSIMGDMIRKGVITGARKNYNKGLHIGCFAGGDLALYETLSTNPAVRLCPTSVAVDPGEICKNDNMVSINTIIEMDITGQVCSESIGPKQFSGTGGAFCFAYGALHSKGGRGILAFQAATKKGVSKISSQLKPGAVVSIPRNYVDYVVTEYGIAHLRGRSVKERALQLISIAHPDVRDQLRHYAKEQFMIV